MCIHMNIIIHSKSIVKLNLSFSNRFKILFHFTCGAYIILISVLTHTLPCFNLCICGISVDSPFYYVIKCSNLSLFAPDTH